MLEGNNILIFMGIIVLLVIVATVIAVVSSVAGAAAAIVDDEDGEEKCLTIFAELYKIKHIEKVLRKRSTQHTLERENGSSAERPFKEGVVEGSF